MDGEDVSMAPRDIAREAKRAVLYGYAQQIGMSLAESAGKISSESDSDEATQFLAEVEVHTNLLQAVMDHLRRI